MGLFKIILYVWLMIGDLLFLAHAIYVLIHPSKRGTFGRELLEMVVRILFGCGTLLWSIFATLKEYKEAKKAAIEEKPASEEAAEDAAEDDASEEEEDAEEKEDAEEENAA